MLQLQAYLSKSGHDHFPVSPLPQLPKYLGVKDLLLVVLCRKPSFNWELNHFVTDSMVGHTAYGNSMMTWSLLSHNLLTSLSNINLFWLKLFPSNPAGSSLVDWHPLSTWRSKLEMELTIHSSLSINLPHQIQHQSPTNCYSVTYFILPSWSVPVRNVYSSAGLFQELLMASLFHSSPYSILHEANSQGDSLQCKLDDDFTQLFKASQRFPLFSYSRIWTLFKEYIKGVSISF